MIDEVDRVAVAVGVGGEPREFLCLRIYGREPLEGGDVVSSLKVVFVQCSSGKAFLPSEKVAIA